MFVLTEEKVLKIDFRLTLWAVPKNYLMIQAFRAVRKNLTERVELKKVSFNCTISNLRKLNFFSVPFCTRGG